MKKFFLMISMVLMAALALNAVEYSGTIVVKMNSITRTADVTVTVIEQENGLYELDLDAPIVGLMKMYDVPAASAGDITTYSAVRDVNTNLGVMNTNLMARTTNGMMTADVTIPSRSITMFFNTVGNYFQLPNSDMEDWNSSYQNEPNRWHGFKSASGNYASFSPALLGQSEDIHEGANGQFSAMITAKNAFGTIANGTMTNGRLNAGAMSASDTRNHAEMDKSKGTNDFYMPLYAKPDKFNVWLKCTNSNANHQANVSVKTFDGTYYQEPVDKEYTNLSGSIVGGQISNCDWTLYSFPFDYDSYAANNAESKAIFVTFSTNATPGQGSANDILYIDDIELVYLAAMTDLRYQGETISGWDPAVTEYSMELSEAPVLDDFAASIEGASAVVTKSMEQNADGSYRIAISVVSGDLQTATCYIINATVADNVLLGDVDGNGFVNVSDATLLISYVLNGNVAINELNADMDGNSQINISDITLLINYLLTH